MITEENNKHNAFRSVANKIFIKIVIKAPTDRPQYQASMTSTPVFTTQAKSNHPDRMPSLSLCAANNATKTDAKGRSPTSTATVIVLLPHLVLETRPWCGGIERRGGGENKKLTLISTNKITVKNSHAITVHHIELL